MGKTAREIVETAEKVKLTHAEAIGLQYPAAIEKVGAVISRAAWDLAMSDEMETHVLVVIKKGDPP